MFHTIKEMFSSPHGDFSFSMIIGTCENGMKWFSSPHGDFSFSIGGAFMFHTIKEMFSSPHGDFSFSIEFY